MSKPVFEDLFTFSGRRNRKSYLLYCIAMLCVSLVSVLVIAGIGAATGGIGFILYLLLVPFVVSSWAVGGQRCRDFGWTGWAVLLTMIPYVGLLFAIGFMVVPGSQGENRYGADPLGGATPIPAQ